MKSEINADSASGDQAIRMQDSRNQDIGKMKFFVPDVLRPDARYLII